MNSVTQAASIIMAAGRGSRMKGYSGNKTLLPLIPSGTPFVGKRPMLIHLMSNLPEGSRAIIASLRDYIKDKEDGKYGEYHLGFYLYRRLGRT